MQEWRRQAWWTSRINEFILHYQCHSDEIFENLSTKLREGKWVVRLLKSKQAWKDPWVGHFVIQSRRNFGWGAKFLFLFFFFFPKSLPAYAIVYIDMHFAVKICNMFWLMNPKIITAIPSYIPTYYQKQANRYLQFHNEIHLMFVFKGFQQLDNVRMFQPGSKPK